MTLTLFAIACGVLALLYGIFTSGQVLRAPAGNQRMVEVAGAIQEGAKAYLGRQYTTIGIVGVVVAALIFFLVGPLQAIGFALGALLSGAAGYTGMNISVRANVRTAEAARSSLQSGLTLAFRAGAVTGMLVAGLALLAISFFFYVLVGVVVSAQIDIGVGSAMEGVAGGG
jgi:K(+)-stimulated pyrophosphate-energized sodium pump